MGFGKRHLFFGCDIMKFFIISLFLLLLFDSPQGSSLSHRRSIRGLNTTLQTNFNGTYQRRNPCTNAEIETSSYAATHEFRHYTKEDDWSDYSRKCSAIISSFLQAIGNLVRFNNKQNGTFNFHINTSISQKQVVNCDPSKSPCNSLPTIIIEATDGEINQRPPPHVTELPPCERKYLLEGHSSNRAGGMRDGMVTNMVPPGVPFGEKHGNQKSTTEAYRKPTASREQEILCSETSSTIPAYQPDTACVPFQDVRQSSERKVLPKNEKIPTISVPIAPSRTRETVSPLLQYITDTEGPSPAVFNNLPQNLQTESDRTSTIPEPQTEIYAADAIRPEDKFIKACTPTEIQSFPESFDSEIPAEPPFTYPKKPEPFNLVSSPIPPEGYNQKTQFSIPKTTPNVPFYHSTPESTRPGIVNTFQPSLVNGQQQPNINSEQLLSDNLGEPMFNNQQSANSFTPENQIPTTVLPPASSLINSLKDETLSDTFLGHTEQVPPALVGSTVPPTPNIRVTTITDEITQEEYSSPRPAELPLYTKTPLSPPVPEPVRFSQPSISVYEPDSSSLPPQIPNVPTLQQPHNRFMNPPDPQILSDATTPTQSENQATDSFLPPAAAPEYDELSDQMPVTKPPLAEDNFYTDALQSYNYDEQTPSLEPSNPIPTTPPSLSGLPPDYIDSDAGIPRDSTPAFFPPQFPNQAPIVEQTKPQIADAAFPPQPDISNGPPSNIREPISDNRPLYSTFAPKKQFLAEDTSAYSSNEFPSTISPENQNYFAPESQLIPPPVFSEQNLEKDYNESSDKITGTQLPLSGDHLPTVSAPINPPNNEFSYPDPTFNPNIGPAGSSTFQTTTSRPLHPEIQPLHPTIRPNFIGPKPELVEPSLQQQPTQNFENSHIPPVDSNQFQTTPGPQHGKETHVFDSSIPSQQTPKTFLQPELQIPHTKPFRNFPSKFPSEQQSEGNFDMTQTQTPTKTYEVITTETYTTAGPESQPTLENAGPYENRLPDLNTYDRQPPLIFRPPGNAPFAQFPPTFPPPKQQPTGNYEQTKTFPPTVYENEQTTIGPTQPPMEYDETTDLSDPAVYEQQAPDISVVRESQLSSDSHLNQSPSTIIPGQKMPQLPLQPDRTTPAPVFHNQRIPVTPTETEPQLSNNVPFRQFPTTVSPEQFSVGNYEMAQSQENPQLQTTTEFESQGSELTVFPDNLQTPDAFLQSDSNVGPNSPLNQFPSPQPPVEVVQPSSDVMFQDPQSQITIGPEFQPPLEYGSERRNGLPNTYTQADPKFASNAPSNRFPSEQQPIENYEGQTTPAAPFEILQTTVEPEIANERGFQMSDPSNHNQQPPNSFAQPDSQFTSSVPNNPFSPQQPLQNYETVPNHSTSIATTEDFKSQTIAPPQPQLPFESDRTTTLPGPVFYNQQIPNTFVQPESVFTGNAPTGQFPPTVAVKNYNTQGQSTVTMDDSILQTTAAPESQNTEEYPQTNDRMSGFPDTAIYNQEIPGSSIQPDSQLINNAVFGQFPSTVEQQENYSLEQSQSTPAFEDSVLQTTEAPESQNLDEYGIGRTTGHPNPAVYNQETPRRSVQPDSQLRNNEPFSQFPSTSSPEKQPIGSYEVHQPQTTSTAVYKDPRLQTVAPQYTNDRTPVMSDPNFYDQQVPNAFIPTDSQTLDDAPFTTLAPERQIENSDMPQPQLTSAATYEDPQLQSTTDTETPVQYPNERSTGLSDFAFSNQQHPNNFAQPDSQLGVNAPTNQFPPTFPAEQPVRNYEMKQNQFIPAVTTEGPQFQTKQPPPEYENDGTPLISHPYFYNQRTPNTFTPTQPADNKPLTTLAPGQQTRNHEIQKPQRTTATELIETEYYTTAEPNKFVQPESQVAASQQYFPPMSPGYQPFNDRSFPYENSTSHFNDPETGKQVASPSYNNQPFVNQDEFQAAPLASSDRNFGPTTQIPFYGPTLKPFENQPGLISSAQNVPDESLNEPLGNTEHTRTTSSLPDPNASVRLEVQPMPSTASESPYPGQILNDKMVTPILDTSALNSEHTAPVISSPIRQSPTDIYDSDSFTTANPSGDDYQDLLYSKPENPSFMTPRPIFNYATGTQTYVTSEQSSTDPSVFGGDQLPTNNYRIMTEEPQTNQNFDGQSLDNKMQTQTSDVSLAAPVSKDSIQDISSEISHEELGNNESNIDHTPPSVESYTPYSGVPVRAATQPTPFILETNLNGESQMTDQFEQGPSTIAPYAGDDLPREAQRKFSPRPILFFGSENPYLTNLETTPFPHSKSSAADAYSETGISHPASHQFSSERPSPAKPPLHLNQLPVVENPTETQPSGYGMITPAPQLTTYEEPSLGSPTPFVDLSQRQPELHPIESIKYPDRQIKGRPKPIALEPTAYTQPPRQSTTTIYESDLSDPNQAQSIEPSSEGGVKMPATNFFTGHSLPPQSKDQPSFIPRPTLMPQPEQLPENWQPTERFYNGDQTEQVSDTTTTPPPPTTAYPLNYQQNDIQSIANFSPPPAPEVQSVPSEQLPNIGATAFPPQLQRDAFSEYNTEITSPEPPVVPLAIPQQLGDSNQMSSFGPSETFPPLGQQPGETGFGGVNPFVTPQPSSPQTISDSNEYVSYAQTQSSSKLPEPHSLISTVGNDQPLQGTDQPSYVPESQTKTTLPYSNEPSVDLKPSFAESEHRPLDSPLETTPWLLTRNQTIKPNNFQNLDSTFAQTENISPSYNSPWVRSGTTAPPAFTATVPPQFPSGPNQELDASLPTQPVKVYNQIPSAVSPQFPPPPSVIDPAATMDYPSASPSQSSEDYYSDAPGYDANPPDYTSETNAEEFQTRPPAPEANIPLNYADNLPPVVAEGTPELQGNGPYVDEIISTSQPNLKSHNVQEETPMYLPSFVNEPQPQPSLDYTTEIPDYKTTDGLDQTSRSFDNSPPLQLNSGAFTTSGPHLANTFQPEPQAADVYSHQINPNADFSQNSGEDFNTPTVTHPPALGSTDMVTETPIPHVGQGTFNNPSTPYQTFPTSGRQPVVEINPLALPGQSETQPVLESNVLPEIQRTAVNYDGKTNAYQSSPAPQPQTTLKYVKRLSDDNIANISPDQTVTASPEFETTPAMTYEQFSPSRNPEIPGTQYQPISESQPESSPLSESQQLGSVDPQGPHTKPTQQTGGIETYYSYPSPQTSQPQPNLPLNDQTPVNGIPFYDNQQEFQPTDRPFPAIQFSKQVSPPPFLGQKPTTLPPPALADEVTSSPAYPIPESQNVNDRIPTSDSLFSSQTQPPSFGTYSDSNSQESVSSPSSQPPMVGPQTQPPFMSFPPTFERQTTPSFIPYSTEPPFNNFQERTTENVQEITDFPTDSPFHPQLSHLNGNNNNNELPPLRIPPPPYSQRKVPYTESSSYSDPQATVRNTQEDILENLTSPGAPPIPANYDEGFFTQPPENRFTEYPESAPTARNPEDVLTGRQPLDGLTGQPGSHDSQLPIRPQTNSPLDFEEGQSRRPMIFTPESQPSTYSPLQEETSSNPLLQTLESHLSIPLVEPPQSSSFPEPTVLDQINTTPIPNYSFPPKPQTQYGVSPNPPYFRRPEFDRNFVTSQPQPNAGVNTSQDVTNAPQPDSRALVSDPTTPSNEPDRTRTRRHGYMSRPVEPFREVDRMRSFYSRKGLK